MAWVALAPLLVGVASANASRALRLGYLTGAVSSLGLVYWTALVVVQYGGMSLPVGLVVMSLLCLALAVFPSLFAWLVGVWVRAVGPGAVLLAPVAWVAMEMLRSHTLFRFAWCLLGYSQYRNLPFIQISAWTAVYGVSFLVAFSSAVLAYLTLEPRAAPRRRALFALVVVIGLVWAQGSWLLSRPIPEKGRVRVGLVQADILQEEKWVPGKARDNVERHIDLTRRAAAAGARLVIWPESAVPYYFDLTPALARQLRALVSEHGLHLLFGNDDREDGDRVFVGAKMLSPDGELVIRYHKIRLVPFGEYVPLQRLLTLGGRYSAKLVQQVADFTPGTEPVVGHAGDFQLGAFICYEAIFPDLVRGFVVRGADLLVNITNDGWYGRTSAPYQHFSMALFRAVENGKYLVRAANTGITAVVDPRGRVLARTELFEPTVLVYDVPIAAGSTFYARHGDLFGWACLGAAIAFTAAIVRPRRA